MVSNTASGNRNERERRRYFRIDDELLFHYVFLSPEEKAKQMERLKSGEDLCPDLYHTFLMLESDIVELINKAKKEQPMLAQAIELLNRKVNVISKGPPSNHNQGRSVFDAEPVPINLSGCGLAFMSPKPIEIGSFLQLEYVLLPQKHYIMCIGEAVKCEEAPLSGQYPRTSEKPYRIGVNFVAIRPDDTEKIIQHVIKREAQALRESKRHLS